MATDDDRQPLLNSTTKSEQETDLISYSGGSYQQNSVSFTTSNPPIISNKSGKTNHQGPESIYPTLLKGEEWDHDDLHHVFFASQTSSVAPKTR